MIVQTVERVNYKKSEVCKKMLNSPYKAPDMSRCTDCLYYFAAADPDYYRSSLPSCVYILRAKRRRPCPPGDKCTEYRRIPDISTVYRDKLKREYRVFRLKKQDGEGGR